MIRFIRTIILLALLAFTTPALALLPPLPVVSGITPASGPISGGTPVTISGANFTGATYVVFNVTQPERVYALTVIDDNTITVSTPPGINGAWNIGVTTAGGTGIGSALFTYDDKPRISGISPAGGALAGGTPVIIKGANFIGITPRSVTPTNYTDVDTVTIGGVAVTNLAVVNDSTITATTPAGTAGAQDLVLTSKTGSATGSGLFSYGNAFNVTISDASTGGSWSGGTPDVWTPNASGAAVSATEIAARLATTGVVISVIAAGGTQAGDISVQRPWHG